MRSALLFFVLASVAQTSAAQAPSGASSALTMPRMLTLAPLPRAEFIREWDGLRDAELARIGPDGSVADARLRLAFQHAQGRVMYPFFHWRETDAASIEPDPALAQVISKLPAIDERIWEFREVREYLDARLHELARQHLASDPDLARGDARWLRAELRSLDALLGSRGLWMRKASELLAKHIDDDGAHGVDEPMGWWLARSPPAESVRKINDAIAADRAHLRCVCSVRYR